MSSSGTQQGGSKGNGKIKQLYRKQLLFGGLYRYGDVKRFGEVVDGVLSSGGAATGLWDCRVVVAVFAVFGIALQKKSKSVQKFFCYNAFCTCKFKC